MPFPSLHGQEGQSSSHPLPSQGLWEPVLGGVEESAHSSFLQENLPPGDWDSKLNLYPCGHLFFTLSPTCRLLSTKGTPTPGLAPPL